VVMHEAFDERQSSYRMFGGSFEIEYACALFCNPHEETGINALLRLW
jgi:hypothetical protein